jgi:hypothetical protein
MIGLVPEGEIFRRKPWKMRYLSKNQQKDEVQRLRLVNVFALTTSINR